MSKRSKYIVGGIVLVVVIVAVVLFKHNQQQQALEHKDIYVAPPTQTVTKSAPVPAPKTATPKKK